jgi:hypothetical protein
MERIKFRQHAERIIERLGYSGKIDIAFERERLMSPATLTLMLNNGDILAEIETPTKTKVEQIIKQLEENGKLSNELR